MAGQRCSRLEGCGLKCLGCLGLEAEGYDSGFESMNIVFSIWGFDMAMSQTACAKVMWLDVFASKLMVSALEGVFGAPRYFKQMLSLWICRPVCVLPISGKNWELSIAGWVQLAVIQHVHVDGGLPCNCTPKPLTMWRIGRLKTLNLEPEPLELLKIGA